MLISSPRRMVCIKLGARVCASEGKGGDTKGLTYIHVYTCCLVQVNAPRSALPGVLTAEKRALVQGQQSPMHVTPPDGDEGEEGNKNAGD